MEQPCSCTADCYVYVLHVANKNQFSEMTWVLEQLCENSRCKPVRVIKMLNPALMPIKDLFKFLNSSKKAHILGIQQPVQAKSIVYIRITLLLFCNKKYMFSSNPKLKQGHKFLDCLFKSSEDTTACPLQLFQDLRLKLYKYSTL